MRFRLIDAMKAGMTIERMCALMDVSVSGFYAWKSREPSRRQLDDMILLAHIRAQFSMSNEAYGAPRIQDELKEDGLSVGRHRVARLMRDNGLKALQKRRYKRTTDSCHGGPVAANLLDQDFTCPGAEHAVALRLHLWCASSRMVRGAYVWNALRKEECRNALLPAVRKHEPKRR
jgi:putative transposase